MIEAPSDEAVYSGEDLVEAVNTTLVTIIHIVEVEALKQDDMGFKFEATAMRNLIAKFEALKTP